MNQRLLNILNWAKSKDAPEDILLQIEELSNTINVEFPSHPTMFMHEAFGVDPSGEVERFAVEELNKAGSVGQEMNLIINSHFSLKEKIFLIHYRGYLNGYHNAKSPLHNLIQSLVNREEKGEKND